MKLTKICFLLLVLSAALCAQSSYTYTYNGAPLFIFTDAANLVTIASIPVNQAFSVQKVTINVNVAYNPVGDINLFAYAPDGTRTKLVERNCGSQATLVNITFDDSAGSKYSDACPAQSGGSFRGNEPLSNFNGKNSYGVWRLAVENNGSQNIGWLNGWSITFSADTITTPTLVDVVNRSSLKGGAVAPNSLILLYGSNLGPATPVYAPANQNLPTTISDVQVLLNDVAIPLKGVSSVGIEAIVPADAVVGETAYFQISVNGTKSNKVSAVVQATAPGLFSQGQLGDVTSGSWAIVKAVDQSYKPINTDNPAVPGSIVTVYATGLGGTDPSFPAGQVPPNTPLYITKTPTNASIGGMAASVLFAGLAPGFPGAYQLNIQVPSDVASGFQQMIIWNGGGVSQDNLSIPIKAK
jgi:uncharacterized protein (TIGR03437 family)